jgi:SAM-dependent methyltransferase
MGNDTTSADYTNRLINKQRKPMKHRFRFMNPYAIHIKRVCKGEVLDIGCGIGRNLEYLGNRSWGVDHNQESVNFAKRRGFQAIHTSEISSSLKHKQFDTFLLAHILEHMPDLESIKLIEEYLPLLKPQGTVVVICPQELGFKHDPTHVNFVKFPEIENVLSAAGLRPIKKYSFPFPRFMGRYWVYNEFIVVAKNSTA